MNAEILCRAASQMRADHGPEHVRHEMWARMAEWLESTARHLGRGNRPLSRDLHAFRVARAYLGESA